MIKPVYEFILWPNCNNHCKFCPQREDKDLLNHLQKIMVLNKVLEFLDSENFTKGSHILIVGGEIFDDIKIEEQLGKFFDKIIDKMLKEEIDLTYMNTNLLYDMDMLKGIINKFKDKGLFDRLKFTTSYDLEGRFNDRTKVLFENNLKLLRESYNDLHIVVNTILTKTTCQSIIDETFNPKEFCDTYKCDINLIPYIIYNKELSASRDMIFKALMKMNELEPSYLRRYIDNFDLPQDKLLYQYKNGELEFCSSDHSECGHSENFKMYSDKGTCFICDLKELFDGSL